MLTYASLQQFGDIEFKRSASRGKSIVRPELLMAEMSQAVSRISGYSIDPLG
jgi:hypothetical protein